MMSCGGPDTRGPTPSLMSARGVVVLCRGWCCCFSALAFVYWLLLSLFFVFFFSLSFEVLIRGMVWGLGQAGIICRGRGTYAIFCGRFISHLLKGLHENLSSRCLIQYSFISFPWCEIVNISSLSIICYLSITPVLASVAFPVNF